ncbi:MAG: substrate-binding domain-containing protein [Kiritimatiellae bacterium]|nr:substrate-binding domain-containing protein [Kiritimatiellia bacterium]
MKTETCDFEGRRLSARPASGRSVLAMISSPVASRIDAVSRFAREHGWHLMFQDRLGFAHPFDWDGDGVVATIRNDKRVLAFLRHLSGRGIPIVDMTFDKPDFPCARVSCNHVEAGRLAAAHFLERNYRSLVFFSIDWGNVQERLWRGFSLKIAPRQWVFSRECPRVRWNDWGAVSNWLERKFSSASKPLGVLTYSQGEAVQLLAAALRLGIRVPEELGIVSGGEDSVLLESQPVTITAVDTDMGCGAYEAAALLQRLMDGETAPAQAVELPPRRIIARRSTDATVALDPLVRAAIELFVAGMKSGVNVESAARSLGVSRNTLNRRISAELGRTASAELLRQRLMLAKRLLADPENKVEYVARLAGFSSASHLGSALRADCGLSPMAFRL